MPLLQISHLTLDFTSGGDSVRAVDDVSLAIHEGETVCLVGESGCGKTVTALSIARLVPCPPATYRSGQILLGGEDVLRLNPEALLRVRGGLVSYVFQEPGASLNPVMPIGKQILEALRLHRPDKATAAKMRELLQLVGIAAPETRMRQYPFQLSGGMQQRVMIAMALASEPRLLVADEPTTALDVTIQAQIMQLLRELKQRLGMALLLITHNLGLAVEMADRVVVMYAGQVVEQGPAADVLLNPLHPYTRALLQAVPQLESGVERLTMIPGAVPRPGEFPRGCRFYPRCPSRQPPCDQLMPELVEIRPGRWARSFYATRP